MVTSMMSYLWMCYACVQKVRIEVHTTKTSKVVILYIIVQSNNNREQHIDDWILYNETVNIEATIVEP